MDRRFYLFDGFRVDATERLLFKENREVSLTPKVFDTLLVLLDNSSHVLTKKELMEKVWPDSFVEENNLAQRGPTAEQREQFFEVMSKHWGGPVGIDDCVCAWPTKLKRVKYSCRVR